MATNYIDRTILELNIAIKKVLIAYLPSDKDRDEEMPVMVRPIIRFELFEKPDEVLSSPTLIVFLYDIHEDLEIRQAHVQQRLPSNGELLPRTVNLRCRYLVSYWETPPANDSTDESRIGPENQASRVMNRVLNALLNAQTLKDSEGQLIFKNVPKLFARVMPPAEHLNSLGNFWQSLGNKPRLCLSYEVTVPVCVGADHMPDIYPVTNVEAALNGPSELKAQAEQYFNVQLARFAESVSLPISRSWIDKIQIKCQRRISDDQKEGMQIIVHGSAPASLRAALIKIFEDWERPFDFGPNSTLILSVDYTDLTFISKI